MHERECLKKVTIQLRSKEQIKTDWVNSRLKRSRWSANWEDPFATGVHLQSLCFATLYETPTWQRKCQYTRLIRFIARVRWILERQTIEEGTDSAGIPHFRSHWESLLIFEVGDICWLPADRSNSCWNWGEGGRGKSKYFEPQPAPSHLQVEHWICYQVVRRSVTKE